MQDTKKRRIIRYSIVLAAVATVFLFLHTKPVRIKVLRTLESSLEKRLHFKFTAQSLSYNLLSLRFKLKGISISGSGGEGMPAFFQAEEASVRVPLSLVFKRGLKLSNLEVHRPRLFYVAGQDGKSNMPFSSIQKNKIPKRRSLDFRLKNLDIENALVRFVDESRQIEGELDGLRLKLRWIEGTSHSLDIRMENEGYVFYKNNLHNLTALSVLGRFDGSDADIERFSLNVAKSQFEFSGTLSDFSRPSLIGSLDARLDLDDISGMIPYTDQLSGQISVEADVEGPVGDLTVRMDVTGDPLSIDELGDITMAAQVFLSRDSVSISPLELFLAGGRLEGEASLHPFDRNGGNRVDLEWDSLSLDSFQFLSNFFKLFSSETSGTLQASWSAFGLDTLEGRTEISLSPPDMENGATEKIPVSGSFHGDFRNRQVHLSAEEFLFPGLRGEASVQVDRDAIKGEWKMESREIETALSTLSTLLMESGQKALPDLKVGGILNLAGEIGGTLGSPVLRSEWKGESISLGGLTDLGFRGQILFRPSTLDINSTLVLPGEGQVLCSGSYLLSPGGTFDLKISGEDLSLETVLMLSGQDISAKGSVRFEGSLSGSPKEPQLSAEGVLSDFSFGEIRLESLHFKTQLQDKILEYGVIAPGYRSRVDGFLSLAPPYHMDAEVKVDDFELEKLRELVSLQSVKEFSGNCQARLNLSLDLARPKDTWSVQTRIDRFFFESGPLRIANEDPVSFSADPGSLTLEHLKISGNGMNLTGTGHLDWKDRALSTFSMKADADLVALSEFFPKVTAQGRLNLDVALDETSPDREYRSFLTLSGGRFMHGRFRDAFEDIQIELEIGSRLINIQTCSFTMSEADFSLRGHVPLHNLPLSLPLEAGFSEDESMDLHLEMKNLQSVLADAFLEKSLGNFVGGRMDADIQIRGKSFRLPQISAEATAQIYDLSVSGFPLSQETPIKAVLDGGRLLLLPLRMSGSNAHIQFAGTMDLMDSNRLDLDVKGDLDLSLIQGYVKNAQIRGACGFDFRILGTPAAPIIEGRLGVHGAGMTIMFPQLYLDDLNGQIRFEDKRILLENFTCLLNSGRVGLSGWMNLENWSLSQGELSLGAKDVLFNISGSLRSQISSDIRYELGKDEQRLSGDVFIHYGQLTEDINLESTVFRLLRRGTPLRTIGGRENTWLDSLRWQVSVTTLNPLVIENNLIRSQASAAVNLTGTFMQPGLTGRVESPEGGKLYFGKNQFLIRRATVDFINPRLIEPELNVTAVTQVGEYEITLNISGTPENLSASLSSNPPLTESNIVSLLVTGVTLEGTATSLLNATGSEALSYMDSVLTGKLESALEKSLGLDSVRIDAGLISSIDNPVARITLQQHLARNMQLIFSQNLQTARNRLWVLDYYPLPSVNVQAIKEDNNELLLSFRNEIRFGSKSLLEKAETKKKTTVGKVNIEGTPFLPERTIINKLHLRSGSLYNEFKLFDGLDRLRGLYARFHFLNPSLVPLRTEEDGKMQIVLQIDAGPKVLLDFSGDSIPAVIKKEATQIWMKNPFDKLAISSIEERLRRYYFDRRYFQATVSHQLISMDESEQRILFEIDRGPKYKKPTLRFEGNLSIGSSQLEAFVRRDSDFHLLFIDSRKPLRRLERYYVLHGFFRPELEEPGIEFDSSEKKLTVTFKIQEGPRYKIGRLAFEGNVFFSASALREGISIREDDFFLQDEIGIALTALEEAYARKGFNQVRIDVMTDVDDERGLVDLIIRIEENEQGLVGDIRISGHVKTSEKVILRELDLEKGDLVDYRLINRARKRLYDLGIFERVQIEAAPLESTSASIRTYRIDIEVVEFQPYRLRYGLQYDTETSLGLSTELINRNLFGHSILTGTSFRLNRDEKDLKGFFRSPYFLSKKISTEFFLFFNSSDKPSFRLDKSGLTVQQQTKLGQFSILSLSYSYEQVRTDWLDSVQEAGTEDAVHHEGAVNLSLSRDSRDSIMNPRRGLFLSQNIGYSAGWLGSEVSFLRYFGEIHTYKKISESFVYAFAFRLGLGRGLGQDLSLSQRFFAGGGTTVRGFGKNELGPKNPETGLAEGGDAVLIMNHELRFSLTRKWGAAIFLDVGNVFSRVSDIAPFDLREVAGFGIRYHTRFILLRVDWGFKLDRRSGESLSRIFFSIGQVF